MAKKQDKKIDLTRLKNAVWALEQSNSKVETAKFLNNIVDATIELASHRAQTPTVSKRLLAVFEQAAHRVDGLSLTDKAEFLDVQAVFHVSKLSEALVWTMREPAPLLETVKDV